MSGASEDCASGSVRTSTADRPGARRWYVIVNPTSGRGRAARSFARLAALIDDAGLDARVVATRGPMHATELAAEAVAAGYRQIAAVGGDGTANEVVNGLMRQTCAPVESLTVAAIPIGTGNDWARSLRMPKDLRSAVALLADGRRAACDLGRIEFEAQGRRIDRHFVNVAGAGFDAEVLRRLGARKPGAWAYLHELLAGFRHYRARELVLASESIALRRRALVAFAGLGRYCGGGMLTAPRAQLDDGRLDVTLIDDMSGPRLLLELRRLFDGSLPASRQVTAWQASRLSIEGDEDIGVEADGELLGSVPARIEVLPRVLQVIAGEGAALAARARPRA